MSAYARCKQNSSALTLSQYDDQVLAVSDARLT